MASAGAGGSGGTLVGCGTPEICGNAKDDDCDGATDETPCRYPDSCSLAGDQLPGAQAWSPTAVGMESPPDTVTATVDNASLHLKDTGTTSGTWLTWGKDCFPTVDTEFTYVAEFQIRAVSSSTYGGFQVALGAGSNRVELTLFPDELMVGGSLGCEARTVVADLSESTTVRLELTPGGASPDTVRILVDGEDKGTATPCAESHYDVSFGLGSAEGTGEGYVEEIHVWREKR